ncbi:hypothetical protein C4K01_4656 [Pseudomonas synxantha]|nr:hypothetical protein C4K01_4656 [Pseudomonas synxantha]
MVLLLITINGFGHYLMIDPRPFGRVSIIFPGHFISLCRFGFMFCPQPTRMPGTFRLHG